LQIDFIWYSKLVIKGRKSFRVIFYTGEPNTAKHGWRKVSKSPNSSKKIIENDWSRNLPGKERRKTALVGDGA